MANYLGDFIRKIFPVLYNLWKISNIHHKELKTIINDFKDRNNSKIHISNVEILNGSSISKDSIIGEFTYIGKNCSITRATIGRYCSIADNVTIGAGEHYLNRVSTSCLFYDSPYEELTQSDCIIGNDVWIGVDSIIRRGVKIGNGAVVGANSFVNIDVPDFAIVVGSPCKILKYRFNQDKVSSINNSQWWAFPLDEARKKISELALNS